MSDILTILIPTFAGRNHYLVPIVHNLKQQIDNLPIGILINDAGREMSIGTKRQKMIEESKSEYIVFVDDDDWVTENYISLIWNAIETKPDVVGMRGWITTNGGNRKSWSISTEYLLWANNVNGFDYVRYPNHLSPVKRKFALQAGFNDMKHGEDFVYSMRLKEQGNLITQSFIDEEIYHYRYIQIK